MRGVWVLLAMLLVLSWAGTLPETTQFGVMRGAEGDPELRAGGPVPEVKIQFFPREKIRRQSCRYYKWVNGKKVYFTRSGCFTLLTFGGIS